MALLCVPGGALWALSPLGVQLSELKYKSPDTFWKLFPSTVILMALGMIGLRLWRTNRSRLADIGFYAVLLSVVLVLIGDVLKFYLKADDVYLLTAPGWRTLRFGLLVFALGSLIFGIGSLRSKSLPRWAVLPFLVFAACGTLAVIREIGEFGAALWVLFGAGWVWLGLIPIVEFVVALWSRLRGTSKLSKT